MLRDVCARLLGKTSSLPAAGEQAVWAAAANFFGQRVQDPDAELNLHNCENPDREPDMGRAAAQELRAVLAGMEASIRLHYNKEAVCADITNANPKTQKDLQRVAPEKKVAVDKMLQAVVAKLMDQNITKPSTPDEAKVWADSAAYLAARIQSSASDCPGRDADMSPGAAAAMRGVLAQIEAFGKLYSNRQNVVQDIINPSPQTQPDLKRVQSTHKICERVLEAAVESMVDEVCERLIGTRKKQPDNKEVGVWLEAAAYLHGRIQFSKDQCPGRAPDMSLGATTAMKKVLSQISQRMN